MSAREMLGPRGYNRNEGFSFEPYASPPCCKLLVMHFLMAFKPLG